MRISKVYQKKSLPVSFEIFPPKGDLTREAALSIASRLAELEPDFISVTYSAGGSGNGADTVEVAHLIQESFNIPVMAHMTCSGLTKQTVQERIGALREKGIENVLALRGDLVPSHEDSDYRFAKDLIVDLAEAGFCVGAAAYPEGHISCTSETDNIDHLKQKQDAGAHFFITQLFFDNEYFYRFWDVAQRAGITIPISCGIMPFLSKEQIQRMVFMCGASLPSPIIKLLARYADSPEDLRRAGIDYASEQLVDLAKQEVDGLHLYTMNQPDIARANKEALRPLLDAASA